MRQQFQLQMTKNTIETIQQSKGQHWPHFLLRLCRLCYLIIVRHNAPVIAGESLTRLQPLESDQLEMNCTQLWWCAVAHVHPVKPALGAPLRIHAKVVVARGVPGVPGLRPLPCHFPHVQHILRQAAYVSDLWKKHFTC